MGPHLFFVKNMCPEVFSKKKDARAVNFCKKARVPSLFSQKTLTPIYIL